MSNKIEGSRQKIADIEDKIRSSWSDIRNGDDRITPLEKQRDDLALELKMFERIRNDIFPPPIYKTVAQAPDPQTLRLREHSGSS